MKLQDIKDRVDAIETKFDSWLRILTERIAAAEIGITELIEKSRAVKDVLEDDPNKPTDH